MVLKMQGARAQAIDHLKTSIRLVDPARCENSEPHLAIVYEELLSIHATDSSYEALGRVYHEAHQVSHIGTTYSMHAGV